MGIPKSRSGLKAQISFPFPYDIALVSACDSSLGGISSQHTAPDELLLIYSMCRQAYWGIRVPCSRSRIRVSLHMELIKSSSGCKQELLEPLHLPRAQSPPLAPSTRLPQALVMLTGVTGGLGLG